MLQWVSIPDPTWSSLNLVGTISYELSSVKALHPRIRDCRVGADVSPILHVTVTILPLLYLRSYQWELQTWHTHLHLCIGEQPLIYSLHRLC